ncbi:SRPBCC family protein [Geodermatophilus sp. SYSU D00814]
MSRRLTSEIDVDAPPERVWQVLTAFSSYADWNPFIVRAEGEARTGARLTLRMQPVGGRAMTLRPTVLEAVAGQRLRWLGRLGVPGLLDAEHSFHLEPRSGGGTHLVQDEVFRGVLLPLVGRSLDRGTRPAFGLMDRALKERAEGSLTTPGA